MTMRKLAIMLCAFLLAACTSGYSKEGVTVVSYCLLGGVYMDDTRYEMNHDVKNDSPLAEKLKGKKQPPADSQTDSEVALGSGCVKG